MLTIINKQNSPTIAGSLDIATAQFEPAFYSAKQLLALSSNSSKSRIAGYLSRRVVRHPNDLQTHTTRLQFYLTNKDTEGLYGALLDLFLVLGKKGRPLRERLLRQIARFLRPLHRSVFLTHLKNGVKPHDRLPFTPVSVLMAGVTGSTTVLLKRSTTKVENRAKDPLLEVRDLIDSGQIQEAQLVLEQLVLLFPHRNDIADELLAVYRSTRNETAFSAMWSRVKSRPPPDSKNWLQLAQYFATRTD